MASGQSAIYSAGSFSKRQLIVHHGNGSKAFVLDSSHPDVPIQTAGECGFIIAYDFNGTALWSVIVKGSGSYRYDSVVESPVGELYATGRYYSPSNPVLFYNRAGIMHRTLSPSPKESGKFVVKLDNEGNVAWLTHFETGQHNVWSIVGSSILLGTNGVLYVTDQLDHNNNTYLNHTIRYPNDGVAVTVTAFRLGGIVVALDLSGIYLWHAMLDSTMAIETFLGGIFHPDTGDLFVLGIVFTGDTVITGVNSSLTLPASGSVVSGVLACFSANGAIKWALQFMSKHENAAWHAVSGRNGSIIIMGQTDGDTDVVRRSSESNTTILSMKRLDRLDGFIMSMNSSGGLNWVALTSGFYVDTIEGGSVDADGNIIAMGLADQGYVPNVTADLGIFHSNGTLAKTLKLNSSGKFLVKYSPSGEVLWATLFEGSFVQTLKTVHVVTDVSNNIYSSSASRRNRLFDANEKFYWRTPNTTAFNFGFEAAYITKLRSDGTPCDTGSYILNGVCVPCPAGKFCADFYAPSDCGLNSSTQASGEISDSACVCNAGYFGAYRSCVECPQGSFCLKNSSMATPCGLNSNTTSTGSASASNCLCNAGFFGVNGSCEVCPRNSYCPQGSRVPISCGPGGNTTAAGASIASSCTCDAGFYGVNGSCSVCPFGSFCLRNSATPTECGWTSNTTSTGATSANACVCVAGYFGRLRNCVLCPRGSFCVQNSWAPTLCGSNSNTASTGSKSVNDCACNPGYFGRPGSCVICPKGSYCDGSGASTQCHLNSDTINVGAKSISDCLCNPGYFGVNGSCTECPAGTVQYASGQQTCIPCGGTKVTEKGAATSLDQCVCIPGTGLLNGVCEPCGDGLEQPDYVAEPCYPKGSPPKRRRRQRPPAACAEYELRSADGKCSDCPFGTFLSGQVCVGCSADLVECCPVDLNVESGNATADYVCFQCASKIPICGSESQMAPEVWIMPMSFTLIGLTIMTLLIIPFHYVHIRKDIVRLKRQNGRTQECHSSQRHAIPCRAKYL